VAVFQLEPRRPSTVTASSWKQAAWSPMARTTARTGEGARRLSSWSSKGAKAGGHPDRTADQVRACRQSEDRQGIGACASADDHGPRRRRHRM